MAAIPANVPLDIIRRRKTTAVHELERYMRCKDCSQLQEYPYKRSSLVALRPTKSSAPIRPRSTNQAAIADLFRIVRRYEGNSPMPDVFPDYPAPVMRDQSAANASW